MGFFSSLLDPIKSLLTPGGTNAARKQQEGQQWFGDFANGVGKDAGNNWSDWLKYNRQFNPQLQSGIANAVQSLSPQGAFNSAVRGGNFARAQAQSQSVPLAMQVNPLMAEAYRSQQLNKANDYQNASIQQSQSPEAQNKRLGQIMQMLSGVQNYAYQPFSQAAQMSFGTPRVQVQPGLLDYAGGIIGAMGGRGSVGQGRTQSQGQSIGKGVNGAIGGIMGGYSGDGTWDGYSGTQGYDGQNNMDWLNNWGWVG